MGPNDQIDPDELENEQGTDDVAVLRQELEEMKTAREAERQRLAQLEQELQSSRQQQAGPQLPMTPEGWQYALQAAQLRAQQDEDLQPYLQQLYAQYNAWAQNYQQVQQRQLRDTGRVEAALSQMGIETGTPEHKMAQRALQAGATYEDVETAFLSTLREVRVKGAESRAKAKQNKAANQGAIEGSRTRGRPPKGELGSDAQDPQSQFMASLQAQMSQRAPSSVKLLRREQK